MSSSVLLPSCPPALLISCIPRATSASRRTPPRAACTRRSPTAIGSTPTDSIQIFLNPFNDGRQALVFAVNPLGIQADGALVEGSGNRGGTFFRALESGREVTDLTPDYVYQSKGRLTDYGYEVEIAIPFKTLRFPDERTQTWAARTRRCKAGRPACF